MVDRPFTAQQKGTTARWYSNKTSPSTYLSNWKNNNVLSMYSIREWFLKGISANIVVASWCITGAFFYHILLCNFLTLLLSPKFDKPIG